MMIDINNLDTDRSFWEVYPEFRVVEPFKSLFSGDKSKQKLLSSRKMWFLAICYAPSSSFSKRPKEGKDGTHQVVGEDYLEDADFYTSNKAELSVLIPAFLDKVMTPMQRQLFMFERKLEERERFINETPYSTDNWKQLDDALKNTSAMKTQYSKLVEDMTKEGEDGTTWGDQEESSSEKGLI